MQAIADACRDGRIDGEIVAAVGNHAESPALQRARDQGIAAVTVASPRGVRTETAEADYAASLLGALRDAQVDTVLLAGYMLKIPDAVVTAYSGRIMNIHNALLPSFGGKGMYGEHVHKAVLAYGVKISGCTVHFVDGGYDTGPIILQKVVPVLDDDDWQTLAARVLEQEHLAYPEAVELFAEGRLVVEGRKVRLLE